METGIYPTKKGAMERFKSHKIVEAAKIIDIEKQNSGLDLQLTVEHPGGGGQQIVVAAEARFIRAKVGEYLVKYQNVDGSVYYSVSPAPEFEAGYTKIGDQNADGPVYKIYRDGDNWCAIDKSTFVDLQTSAAGYGPSPSKALANLLNR